MTVLVLSLLCLLVPMIAHADQSQDVKRVTIRQERNVAAYNRPTGHSTFVGWAKMGQQYDVINRVRGAESSSWWYQVEVKDGVKGYIPAAYTSPVLENVEALTVGYVWINPQRNLRIRNEADPEGEEMGWARKQEVYPLLSRKKENGFWKIAMPDNTLGYVSAENAFEYDPVEDAKPRWVYVPNRSLIREHPSNNRSPVMTGIGPGEVLRCVYVYRINDWYNGQDVWYEVETKGGGYGFIHSSVCELIEGDQPSVDASGSLVIPEKTSEPEKPAVMKLL